MLPVHHFADAVVRFRFWDLDCHAQQVGQLCFTLFHLRTLASATLNKKNSRSQSCFDLPCEAGLLLSKIMFSGCFKNWLAIILLYFRRALWNFYEIGSRPISPSNHCGKIISYLIDKCEYIGYAVKYLPLRSLSDIHRYLFLSAANGRRT